jgi:type II secretion system protein N
MALALPFQLGPRARVILRYVGFAVVAVVTFVFTFQLSFPFGRVKEKIVDALSEKYEVTIGDVDGGIMPGRVYLKAVSLRTRPTTADEVANTFYVEQLELDIGLFALLRGTAAVDLDAKIGPGHIKGSIVLAKSATSIDLVGSDLPSASLPVREALGLPMSGKLRFALDLELPNDKSKAGKIGPNWLKAEGHAELACPSGCTVGDGKTKLRPKLKNQRNQAFAEGGIDFGKVNIDSLFARVEIKNGKVDVTKFDTKSSDGELHVDFEMVLNQDMNQSAVTGCLRFRGSDALLKREAKTHAAISTTGAPLGPDNLFHIKLDGQLREVRRLGQVCGAAAGNGTGNGASPDIQATPPKRPNLTVTPDMPPSRAPGSIVPSPAAPAQQYPQDSSVPPSPHVPQPEGDHNGTNTPPLPPPGQMPQQPGEPPPAPPGSMMVPLPQPGTQQ